MEAQQVALLLDVPVAALTWRWGSAGAGSSQQTPSSEQGSSSVRAWQHTGPNLARISYCQAHLQECKIA